MLPLASLAEKGVELSTVLCNNKGKLRISDLCLQIKSNNKAVIMTHASNVSGTILPLEEVGKLCKEHNLFFCRFSFEYAVEGFEIRDDR